jgi:hypothetical protein
MPSRMRRPEDCRIPLLDEDWIVVKKHLTAGEQRAIFTRMIRTMVAGEKVEIEPAQSGLSMMVEYLLDWSILDADGNPVPVRGKSADVKASALEQLDPEKFKEIADAIATHDEAMRLEREAAKKNPGGVPASSEISASVA